MRRALVAGVVVVVVLVAALALVLSAAGDERDLAFTNGASPFHIAAWIPPGGSACQRHVHVEAEFDSAQFAIAGLPPGAPVAVTVTRFRTAAALARGVVPAGFAHGFRRSASVVVRLSRTIGSGGSVDVCVHNRDRWAIGVVGGPDIGGDPSHAVAVGKGRRDRPLGTNMRFVFLRRHPQSALSRVPTMFRRAALFRPSFVGAWTYWALLALVLVAVPALLLRAFWTAERDGPEDA